MGDFEHPVNLHLQKDYV